MTRFRPLAMIATAIMAFTASAAHAQEAAAANATGTAGETSVTSVTSVVFGNAAVLAETDLSKVTGRADTGAMIASATQRNTVSNNSVIGTSTTGNIRIDGNAFQNLQGLAVINANSGNNVAINSALNVTVNLAPR